MTSLRGPDPYASAEERLAPLLARRPVPLAEICRALHESVPTYTWVGLARRDGDRAHLLAQCGTPQRATSLPLTCVAPLPGETTLVIDNLAAAPAFRDCFPTARALIVIPATGICLIVASEHRGAFGLADRALLAAVARHLVVTSSTTEE